MSGFSQTSTLLNEYLSPISNINYKVGDSIIIGVPNRSKNDIFVYKNVFIDKAIWGSIVNVSYNLSKEKGIIVKISSYEDHFIYEFKNSIVFELRMEGFDNLFIPIDKAILSKEVVLFPNPNSTSEHLPFNFQTANILQINAKKLSPESAMLTYIEKLEPKKFQEWKNNEFLYETQKEKYINDVDSVLQIVNIGDTFILVLPVELGSYNFDSNSFPVVESFSKFGETVEFALSKDKLSFLNFTNYTSIPVPRNKAEYFANTCSTSYHGTRSAFVILYIEATGIIFSEEQGGINIGSNIRNVVEYSLSIIDLSCVDSEALYYNYLGGD